MIVVEHSNDTRIPMKSRLISINDHPITDFLEFDFYNDVARQRTVVVEQDNTRSCITFKPDEAIPITLQTPEFRTCENECAFCFIRGLPPGLRSQLYIRDDDYRLSFLFGNFLSMTNITDEDIERIGRLRFSPLYLSVHTTDAPLRIRMFKNEHAGRIMDQIRSLIRHRITLHCQIVVIPGINDGDHLKKSIADLGSLYPGVQSIGIIPVGRTRYAPDLPMVTSVHARDLIAEVDCAQHCFRDRYDRGIVYAADELYCISGIPIPPAAYYDDTPQIENGVGMARMFLDEIAGLRSRKKVKGNLLFVTSRGAVQFIEALRNKLITRGLVKADRVHILPVENKFLGPTVTVSGLLGARDMNEAIHTYHGNFDRIVLPPNCTNDDGEFIDSGQIGTETFVAPVSVKELITWLQS
jgi:putative radical SAM enzyme (TIGR03279 family)